MALYEIDTLKSSLKKYAVVLTVGLGVGVYLSNCTFKPNKFEMQNDQSHLEHNLKFSEQKYKADQSRELTLQEQRLMTFETYTRP